MLQQIEELFKRQTRAWPQLAKGIEGLAHAKTRLVRVERFEILVRYIPHRLGSTTAPVDVDSVAKRPCFLCPQNLPLEEEGVQFDAGFTMYCNPFPILERHLTIPRREHRPQGIANQFGNMLDIAAALPGYFVVYNGAECGASAPDHMHFQAGTRGSLPIENETAAVMGVNVPNYGRNVLLFRGKDRSGLIDRIESAIDLLAEVTNRRPEPLINIAVFHERGAWVVYLFPRGKHRPEVFHTGELTVSPAAIDLCGIFVVPRANDFEKITGDMIAAIFREVTLPDAHFREVAERLENVR
ncbi:MAG TPA: DUF4922 domain-containing protein [Candidatus Binataceae bacterium]|nr:DUF4922 domain-containing protein [Candidatus Binataceae bacterium]